MTSMFWGLRLEPGKRYSTTVDKSFHVSMAALDCSSVKSDNELLSVMIEDGESSVPFILCNLQKNKLLQTPLDLNFMSGDRITLFCKGNGVVHLSGYIAPEDDDDDELGQVSEEEDEEADEISDSEVLAALKGNRKVNGVQEKRKLSDSKNLQSKRKKLEKMDEDSDDSDDEEDDDIASDDMEAEAIGLEEGDDSDEDDDDEDDDAMEDDESDDEEGDEQEDILSKSAQQLKKNKKNKPQTQQSPGQNKQNIFAVKQDNQGKQKTSNVSGLTPNNAAQAKKDKKKGEKPAAGTSKLNKSNNDSRLSTGKKGAEAEASPGKKTLDGGVQVKDIKVGNGPVCKSGKMACVYYTGRFKQNNKVFDSTTDGSGFKFRVGKGEVIKGWDVGVVGMKVGGKRLITCPPPMAYGQKGSPPTIPPNSTLVFEVELKNIN